MRTARIVGGQESEVNEYPWQVALYNSPKLSYPACGGSLISDLWILSAAHCIGDTVPGDWTARLGEHDLSTTEESDHVDAPIILIVQHPQYDPNYNGFLHTPNFDLALFKMGKAINFLTQTQIRPICLPNLDRMSYEHSVAIVTGWGATDFEDKPSSLMEVNVTVLSIDACKNDLGYSKDQISEQMLCANVDGGGKDACKGDSGNNTYNQIFDKFEIIGGPLITQRVGGSYELIGVVSWGKGCGNADYPGVYARVTMQLDWIKETTAERWNTCPGLPIQGID